jgi:hypothetical protein
LERTFHFGGLAAGGKMKIDLAEIDDDGLDAGLVEDIAADAVNAARTGGRAAAGADYVSKNASIEHAEVKTSVCATWPEIRSSS